MKLEGIEDFNNAIKELTQDLRKKVIRAALRAGMKPIIAYARANSKELKKPHPYRIRGLMKSRIVATNSRIATKRGEIGIYMKPVAVKGVTKGAKSPLDPFYYRFIAGGFHAVGSKRVAGGRLTRKANLASRVRAGKARFIPGDDYIKKAFQAKGDEALTIFQKKLKERIDKANRRK